MLSNIISIRIFTTVAWLVAGIGAAGADPIRLGWQTPWATQGQLVMALKHSNIAELVGIELEYPGFAYGGPLNLAALSGEVDVILTADQPAIALMARNSGFKIVARMMYNRTCVYVPVASPVQTLADLKGKTVAGPVGAAAERTMLAGLVANGVALDEVTTFKLDMGHQSVVLAAGARDGRWGTADALYGFDPLVAEFEAQGLARMIDCENVVSLVLASPEMLDARRDELQAFLTGFQLAWWAFANNHEALDAAFVAESSLTISSEALAIAASVEPNWSETDMERQSLTLSYADFEVIDQATDFLLKAGIITAPIDPRSADHLDLGPLDAALTSGRAEDLQSRIEFE